MRRGHGWTRKQFLGLLAAVAGAVFSRPKQVGASRFVVHGEPLIGEPGYDKRVAKLFGSRS